MPKHFLLFEEITWQSSEKELPSAMVRFVQGVIMDMEEEVGWPYSNKHTVHTGSTVQWVKRGTDSHQNAIKKSPSVLTLCVSPALTEMLI